MTGGPTVMVLDGDHDTTLQIARELSVDLDARVVGVGTARFSRLFFSRYCEESMVLPQPDSDDYAAAVLSAAERRRPDVVLPVGFKSVAALDEVRGRVPGDVATVLPPSESLEVAVDRTKTLSLGADLGIAVPDDYTPAVAAADGPERQHGLPEVSFPVFLKARRETGEVLSARVESRSAFWREYDALRSDGTDLVVQDCVDGDGRTYGCGLLFVDGTPRLSFGHVELRSVPRRGGSGTRLRATADPVLASTSVELLEALDWHGVALVEYRFDGDSFVLMEVNPKFWASYALASQCGYRFASTLVAEALDLPAPPEPEFPPETAERVFPLREFNYCLHNYAEESLVEAASAMLWPPVPPDVNPADLGAWLVPPVAVAENSRLARTALGALARGLGADLPDGEEFPRLGDGTSPTG